MPIVDFVVAGILLGSLAVVGGELFRIFGPKRSPAERKSLRRGADPANTPRAWTSACHAIGLLAATVGSFLLLVTLLMTLVGVSDSVGWLGVGIVGLAGTVVTIVGAWTILNHYRSGGFDPVTEAERTVASPRWDESPAGVISQRYAWLVSDRRGERRERRITGPERPDFIPAG